MDEVVKSRKNLKFDMNADEDSRQAARKGYEVAKILKESGLRFRKVIPAHSDLSVRKLFKIAPKGEHLCLEILLDAKTKELNNEKIEEMRDQFLLMRDYLLINDKNYTLDQNCKVHRFLFRPSKIQ